MGHSVLQTHFLVDSVFVKLKNILKAKSKNYSVYLCVFLSVDEWHIENCFIPIKDQSMAHMTIVVESVLSNKEP